MIDYSSIWMIAISILIYHTAKGWFKFYTNFKSSKEGDPITNWKLPSVMTFLLVLISLNPPVKLTSDSRAINNFNQQERPPMEVERIEPTQRYIAPHNQDEINQILNRNGEAQ